MSLAGQVSESQGAAVFAAMARLLGCQEPDFSGDESPLTRGQAAGCIFSMLKSAEAL
jgi:hypothetical protein